MKALSLIS